MRKILIASHGKTASGMKSTVEMFMGDLKIECIDAYIKGSQDNYIRKITEFVESVNNDDGAYIFTDIAGGSVNQYVLAEVMRNPQKKIIVITNMNIPIIIELLTSLELKTIEEINSMVKKYNMMPQVVDTSVLLKDSMHITDDDAFLD